MVYMLYASLFSWMILHKSLIIRGTAPVYIKQVSVVILQSIEGLSEAA
jgi:hypothetical protein